MGRICFMRGKEWWLSKTSSGKTNRRRQYYPDRILVGNLGEERVYVPERTCKNELTGNPNDPEHVWVRCSACKEAKFRTDNYCPNCGAKVAR